MKWRISAALLVSAITFTTGVAFADHTLPQGSIERFERDSRDLYNVVRYSTLKYQVKQAVYAFSYDVEQFVHCVHGYQESRDHDLIPSSCEYDLDRVHNSYYAVNRYLYDTYYDYPQVYSRYLRVNQDMRSLPH